MQDIIKVTENKCKQCYSCVRNCPVGAIQIKNGQATIMYSRCINCGKCIKTCPQNAKVILDSKAKTINMLEDNESKVIACLAPSFIVSFYPLSHKKVVGALKQIGFFQVWEVAVGAEELTRQIDIFLKDSKRKEPFISTPCPAFVSVIEKHFPELMQYLLPFTSPMIATAKIIRKRLNDKNIKIVFVGPCVAKKAEANDPQFEGIIDSVLTFEEMKEIFTKYDVDFNCVEQEEFDSIYCNKGRLFPLAGGLLNNLKIDGKINESEYVSISCEYESFKLIDALSKGNLSAKFADVLMCKGCIEGPKIDSDLNYYKKIKVIYDYYENNKRRADKIKLCVDLKRTYKNRRNILPFPSEEEIREVLKKTDKFTEEDELNCGACGYNTCREKAIAVVRGLAEVEMCLPYLISKKTKLLEEVSQKVEEITLLKEELETVIESSYDGLVVADGNGKILMTNKAWDRMIGNEKDNNRDKLLKDMEDDNIIFPSATLLALKEKRRISFIQKINNNKQCLVTATPIFNDEGEIVRVVSNVRDIEELNRLKQQLEATKTLDKYHSSTGNPLDNIEFDESSIVANSIEFGRVLQVASNVARVDSTVLITGESGVGKEIVANFIHNLSTRKDKSFIKINCGAIPENLIESELFGYETGAFTGARKRGKPGLIELAHEGTLFLDEIGELPLNLQVKLLRVIQEKRFISIGGTEEKEVDVRIIAATNRNLRDLVIEGKFRADLYYRLNVVPLEIPPLRKRNADIIPLCYHFLNKYNKKYKTNKKLSCEVECAILNYDWPGNVRELENLIERLVVTTNKDIIKINDLPNFILKNNKDLYREVNVEGIIPLKEAVEMLEKKLIEKAYKKYNTTYEMAEALGVNQSTVVRKIQKYIKSDVLKHD